MSLTIAKPILVQDIKLALEAEASETESPDQSRQRIAEKIADAVDKFIRAGIVNTTGTATNQTGKVT